MSEYALTSEDLLEFGFKRYAPNCTLDQFEWLYQYCIRDKHRNRILFVNVRLWRNSKYPGEHDGFDAIANFDCDGRSIQLHDLGVNSRTPQEIVEWFAQSFFALRGQTYDHTDGIEYTDLPPRVQQALNEIMERMGLK